MDSPPNLGFLTVLQESTGWIGALLVTNHWGRPYEFHITSPVQPTRIQQILYGPTWKTYICAEVLSKALLSKASLPLDFVVTDTPEILISAALPVPAVLLETNPQNTSATAGVVLIASESWQLLLPPSQAGHEQRLRDLLAKLTGFDFAEPFERLCEAIRESRRLGVLNRAA